jgi:hypothetical protein
MIRIIVPLEPIFIIVKLCWVPYAVIFIILNE